MRISIIGTGYVGLVSGICFAEMGNYVTFMDVDREKLGTLQSGRLPIYEPGLESLLERNQREHRVAFTRSLTEAVEHAEVIFLTLPTPPNDDGSANLSSVLQTVHELSTLIKRYTVIVTKSTVPVGTASRLREVLESRGLKAGQDFDVVSNPEFLREGVAVNDFLKPERVVIGTASATAGEIMKGLYEPFVRNGNPILVMDERSAELVKYASNAFLAMKISFINEIANVCEKVGANVDRVRAGMGKDSRIGPQFLYPGLGYGGSCFPKDVQALDFLASENDYSFEILKAVLRVNEHQRDLFVNRIVDFYEGDVSGKRFALWGLAFKPNTDDVREAPAHSIARGLTERHASVIAYDPEAMENSRRVLGDSIEYASDMYASLSGADALIIATEWNEFRNPDLNFIRRTLERPVIFDGRNLFEPDRLAEMGIEYHSIGRQHIPAADSRVNRRSLGHEAA